MKSVVSIILSFCPVEMSTVLGTAAALDQCIAAYRSNSFLLPMLQRYIESAALVGDVCPQQCMVIHLDVKWTTQCRTRNNEMMTVYQSETITNNGVDLEAPTRLGCAILRRSTKIHSQTQTNHVNSKR